MLVTDTGNNRILSISDSGATDVIAAENGRKPGQFRHPMAVISDGQYEDAGFWGVDHRNHRVQRLDRTGKFMIEIGRCGLGEGTLNLPHAVTLLPDGSLLAAQHQFSRRLTLFSPEGKELDRVALDFTPGNMLAHLGKLLIADADGDFVRVYECI